jgi:prepilin-type N-terminal cleavage/methylation domain-containing protein
LAKTCLVAGATHPRLAKPRLCGQLSVREDFGSPIFPSRHRRPPGAGAFTLIELLIVVSIIAILAGLTLAGLGFVNRKGAESRALTEVAALSSAIENYKLDIGSYPPAADLYNELTGQGSVNDSKVFFEPTPGMINTNVSPRVLVDPYGQTYNYTPENPTRNVGFFDLYCIPPDARGEQDWIHN